MKDAQELITCYNRADEQGKDFLRRLVNVYANGSEAGKKMLNEADIAHMTKQDFLKTLEAAERA